MRTLLRLGSLLGSFNSPAKAEAKERFFPEIPGVLGGSFCVDAGRGGDAIVSRLVNWLEDSWWAHDWPSTVDCLLGLWKE